MASSITKLHLGVSIFSCEFFLRVLKITLLFIGICLIINEPKSIWGYLFCINLSDKVLRKKQGKNRGREEGEKNLYKSHTLVA